MAKAQRIRFGLGEEFRKTTVNNDDLTLAELELMAQRIFKLSPTDTIKIKYKDEDDVMVTVGDDTELQLAMQDFEILKFNITLNEDREGPKPVESIHEFDPLSSQHQQYQGGQGPSPMPPPPTQPEQQVPQAPPQQPLPPPQQPLPPPQQPLPPPQQPLPPPQQPLPPIQQQQLPPIQQQQLHYPPATQQQQQQQHQQQQQQGQAYHPPPPPPQYMRSPLQPPVHQGGYAPNPYSARKRYPN